MPDPKYLASLSAAVDFIERFAPLACAFVIICFVVLRTRSFFFVVYRIQSLVGGAQAFHDERVQKHWKSFEDMHRANLWFGLKLNSSRAMHQLFAWMDRHNISVSEISRAVHFFDTNKLVFTFPKNWYLKLDLTSRCAMALILIFGAFVFTASDDALLYVKKTHTLFWAGSGHANSAGYPITSYFDSGNGWHLSDDYCLFTSSPAPLIEEWDKQVICHLVLGNRDDYIKGAVDTQRLLGWLLIVLSAYSVIRLVSVVISRKQALIIQERVEENERLRSIKEGSPSAS